MLHIILTILKVSGIILGILLAVLFILLLLVLFVPVRYDINGKKREELQVKGKVHWLFHIVSFQIFYEDGELKQTLRIFGVPVWRN